MGTVEEIESAIETLPPEQVDEVFAWLQNRKEAVSFSKKSLPLFGFMKGKMILKPGWDEPLEDFREYME